MALLDVKIVMARGDQREYDGRRLSAPMGTRKPDVASLRRFLQTEIFPW
jgi:hypothetical protein